MHHPLPHFRGSIQIVFEDFCDSSNFRDKSLKFLPYILVI